MGAVSRLLINPLSSHKTSAEKQLHLSDRTSVQAFLRVLLRAHPAFHQQHQQEK
jgi:hypothetical protein